MSRLGDLTLLAMTGSATQEQLDEMSYILNQTQQASSVVQSWTGGNPGTIEPPTAVVTGSGNVISGVDGITIYNDAILTGHLQADGDWFCGSDLSSPDTTTMSVFSNAQTYNSEAMGAGDFMLGSNSSGHANLLWDYSAKQLKFRGGTTVQAYVGTDGSINFSSGIGKLNSDGISIVAGTTLSGSRAYRFTIGDDEFGLYCLSAAAGSEVDLYLLNQHSNAGVDHIIKIEAEASGVNVGCVDLRATGNGKDTYFGLSPDGIHFEIWNDINGATINEFSIDGTMAGNSDTAVPTEKAVVTYVAAQIAAAPGGGATPLQVQMFS